MDPKLPSGLLLIVGVSLLSSISLATGQTIIDDDFGDGTPTGWESIGNSLGATHNITEGDGALTSEVIGTEANLNTNRGIISTTAFNPATVTGGFSMTFEVASEGERAPGANGMFLGVTSSNTTFFRLAGVPNFGIVFFGHAARTQSNGGVSLVTNDIGSGGPVVEGLLLDANPNSIELASLQDGFTATLGADATGWSFSVTDINDPVGEPTTIENTGTWADAGTDYASVFGGATDWYVLASNQGDPGLNTHTVVYDRIALESGAGSGSNELQITDLTRDLNPEDPTVTVIWKSRPNENYALFYSTDCEVWAEIDDSIPSGGDSTVFPHQLLPSFSELVGARELFYRVTPGAE